MIGSWFAQGATWAWEVVAADATVIARGVAPDEATARWECRMAIFVAGTPAGPEVTGATPRPGRVAPTPRLVDPLPGRVAPLPRRAGLAGRWSDRPSAIA